MLHISHLEDLNFENDSSKGVSLWNRTTRLKFFTLLSNKLSKITTELTQM